MPCDREQKPFGYQIQHSNNPKHPAWLVMRWGVIMHMSSYDSSDPAAVCRALNEAYLWLLRELGGE